MKYGRVEVIPVMSKRDRDVLREAEKMTQRERELVGGRDYSKDFGRGLVVGLVQSVT